MRLEQSRARSALEAAALIAVMVGWWRFGARRLVADEPTAVVALAGGAVMLAAIGAMTWLGRSFASVGLRRDGVARDVRTGILFVVPAYLVTTTVSLALAAVALGLGVASVESLSEAQMPIVRLLGRTPPASVLPLALFVATYEEIAFRGFLLTRLAALAGPTAAIATSSVVFGLLPEASQGWLGVVQTTCVGVVLATLTLRRRSLWPAIACHATIDALGIALLLVVARALGGVPDASPD